MTISVEQIIDLEEAHPDAVVMAHPECPADVLAEADYIGSTKGMIEHAAASDAQEFIVCTVVGISRELKLRTQGTGKRFHFPCHHAALREHGPGHAAEGWPHACAIPPRTRCTSATAWPPRRA